MEVLRACDFPGNVRELESCVKRTAALAKNSVIVVEDFACSNESCLSLVLGKSMNNPQVQQARAGYVPLPVVTPPQGRTWPVRKIADPAGSADGNDILNPEVAGNGHQPEDSAECQRLIDAMERSGWVQAKAARMLGLTPRQMGYALRKYSIEIKRF
jgi:Nif-specific regulatory protein